MQESACCRDERGKEKRLLLCQSDTERRTEVEIKEKETKIRFIHLLDKRSVVDGL